jgi:hypothetical protein
MADHAVRSAANLRTALGAPEAFGLRGVWVPAGMTAREIIEGARVLSEQFGVEHYEARSMVRTVLEAIRAPSA